MLKVFWRAAAASLFCSFACLGLANVAQAQSPDGAVAPIKIGLPWAMQTSDGAGCKLGSGLLDPDARAYAELIKTRFNTEVTVCLTNTVEEAIGLAEQGDVNIVWAEPDHVAPISNTWRPILTLRDANGLGRAPFVLFGLPSDNRSETLSEISADEIGFLDGAPEALNTDLAKRVLRDYEVMDGEPFEPVYFESHIKLMEAVEAGDIKAGILESGTWGRACAVLDPTATVCDHFEIIMYDRPRALNALMVPKRTSKERHFRLVGVHIALHLEAPEAMAWLSQEPKGEFEPTEALAMQPKAAESAVVY
ncbi:MAG: PhnD/SsuA/transferrin family substrate-binding protein [Pseudomonadota bacterium]